MKNYHKLIIISAFLVSRMQECSSQTASTTFLLNEKKVVTVRPSSILSNPSILYNIWSNEPLPLAFYTKEEIILQKKINKKVSDEIIAYSPSKQEFEWSTIDCEEITPYTWKWIYIDLPKSDGALTKISLRRPHWWIKKIKADSIGRRVYIDLPEMGAQGWGIVTDIKVNQLDTRLWIEQRKGDYVNRPITGKFEHESNDVYELTFNDMTKPVEVTGEHPFWSLDRDQWVEAKNLYIDEKVRTSKGSVRLMGRIRKDGVQKVYNIEVFKDHTFLVSTSGLVVHNACVGNKMIGEIMKNLKGILAGPGSVDSKWVEKLSGQMEKMMKTTGKVDWAKLGTGSGETGKITVAVYEGGEQVVINGRHRVIAAELSKVPIPWKDSKVVEFKHMPYSIGEEAPSNIPRNWADLMWEKTP